MEKKKFVYLILTFFSFMLLFIGSATSKKLTPLLVPDYSFSPPSPQAPGSAGIKIALIQPNFPGNFSYSTKSPFKNFRTSMGRDLEQILSSRGYIIKGPYDEYDLMTYSDKEECELGLSSDIDLNISLTSGGWVNSTWLNTPTAFWNFNGTIALSGKVTIYILETFTKQKLIVKSLSIPQQIDIAVKGDARVQSMTHPEYIPIEDAGVHNPIATALVEFYKSTLKRTWDLLPKEELIRVKDQVPQIRKEAGFIKR